jgi:glucosyl-3-phosphoglycerate synthase
MSDFHQHGLICTLQRLAKSSGSNLAAGLPAMVAARPVSVVLPCHFSELGQAALAHILDELSAARFIREIVVSMNGMDAAGFFTARNYFQRLSHPCRILWNDGPRLSALYKKLVDAGLAASVAGKGFNMWAAFGLVFVEGKSEFMVTQDCDVTSFQSETLARLCFAGVSPDLDYDYSKMYYSRVTDRIYGRVSRLFLAPLLHALVRVVGHHPLLDFLLSFRYPLSGEYCIRRELAGRISIHGDWGLEIGLLCEIFRAVEPSRVCQVDGGSNHDHKHQPLGADADSGLYKMSKQIARALFDHLADEGLPMDGGFLPAIQSSYRRESRDALQRYRNLALINEIPFDTAVEQHAIDLFSKALDESVGARNAAAPALASWQRITSTLPDFVPEFLAVVEEENQTSVR